MNTVPKQTPMAIIMSGNSQGDHDFLKFLISGAKLPSDGCVNAPRKYHELARLCLESTHKVRLNVNYATNTSIKFSKTVTKLPRLCDLPSLSHIHTVDPTQRATLKSIVAGFNTEKHVAIIHMPNAEESFVQRLMHLLDVDYVRGGALPNDTFIVWKYHPEYDPVKLTAKATAKEVSRLVTSAFNDPVVAESQLYGMAAEFVRWVQACGNQEQRAVATELMKAINLNVNMEP